VRRNGPKNTVVALICSQAIICLLRTQNLWANVTS